MKKLAIASVEDIEVFFNAFSNHDWETVFNYMSIDCIWVASEKHLHGRESILDYWTNYHSAIKETLGKPEYIVFADQMVYLQVKIHFEFIEDGIFLGKSYKKGDTLDFTCADFYKLNDEGQIKYGCVYMKFLHE